MQRTNSEESKLNYISATTQVTRLGTFLFDLITVAFVLGFETFASL
jgi:hypothetical protein